VRLTNNFSVPVPVAKAWATLLDVERVAPCMPGATVDRIDGDDILGSVKVKLGPIVMRYQGTMTFTERDEAGHHTVLTARANESRGGGSVSATISATLAPAGSGTDVSVVTDLDLTGKAAQLGGTVLADVSRHLIGRFATNLAREIQSPSTSDGPVSPKEPDTLNALELLKAPARRLLPPALAGMVIGLVLGLAIGTSRRGGRK
jgi:carbon monoxide dehydrogenase subunit G